MNRLMQSMPFLLVILAQCTTLPMVHVDSTNQNSRIDYLVIHATSENFAESLRLLSTVNANPVSSHYLVPEIDDPTYPRKSLRVYSLVPEHRRAWHAGVSQWGSEVGLNDRSIGIEVVNEFRCTGTERPLEEISLDQVACRFVPYSEAQIALLIELLKSILERYPDIDPIDIVGHSDIAVMRKSDPGPLFPWYRLYQEGIGAWPDESVKYNYQQKFSSGLPSVTKLQQALSALGYQTDVTGEYDAQTRFAVRALQLHFRAADYSGRIDVETAAILWALLEKYRPQELAGLSRADQADKVES